MLVPKTVAPENVASVPMPPKRPKK
jgi:hypothetical protein